MALYLKSKINTSIKLKSIFLNKQFDFAELHELLFAWKQDSDFKMKHLNAL
jgi:hypothetical protein